jgi:hypothetical protein
MPADAEVAAEAVVAAAGSAEVEVGSSVETAEVTVRAVLVALGEDAKAVAVAANL